MKKRLESLCIFLIVAVFIIIGYYTYQSYIQKKESNDGSVEINNYYNAEYLFNSGYIKNASVLEKSKDIDYTFEDDSLNIEYTFGDKTYNKRITNCPSKEVVYYNYLYDGYYEFLIKKDDSVYYTYANLLDSKDSSFSVIKDHITEIYIPVYDKEGIYVNKNSNLTSNFILSDKKQNLKYIDYEKEYILKDNIEDKKPYFDYIYANSNSSVCDKLIIYITFNKELLYNKEIIKNNDKNIYVKDIFSNLEINSNKKIDIVKASMSDLENNNYKFISYIIDKKGIMYEFVVTKDSANIEKINSSSNKVKEYKFNKENLSIVFDDGTKREIKNGDNSIITTSTIYDKKESINKTITP